MELEQCPQLTAKGQRCRNRVVRGGDRCTSHMPVQRKRQTLFTEEAQDRVVQFIRSGSYIEVAAAAAGIARRTYYLWMERGDPAGSEPANAPYRAFRGRVEQALAEGEARNVAVIASAANDNWQASAWLLERRHPQRWARASQREKDEPAAVVAPGPDDPFAEVDELAQRRRQRG